MNIAIVHYHLRGGGVTRVIDLVAGALLARGVRVAVFTGEPPGEPRAWHAEVVESIRYGGNGTGPAGIASDLLEAAARVFGTSPDAWHFHNHALGKNAALTQAVDLMARRGEAMLLQLHDFAEDGRPENLRALAGVERLYPHSPRVRLGFLNHADLKRFRDAGLPESEGVVLPNPIVPPTTGALPEGPPMVLYPVRAIPRKNLPEFLLLAALAPLGARFAVTQTPENPAWQDDFKHWRKLAATLGLPLELGVVGRVTAPGTGDASFEAWTSASTHFASTSISEGFGMTFLEAVAAGRPVIGRNLPNVTADHEAAGLRTDWLYDRLLVDGLDFRELSLGEKTAVLEAPHRRSILAEKNGRESSAEKWLAEALGNRSPAGDPKQLLDHTPAAIAERCHAIYQQLGGPIS